MSKESYSKWSIILFILGLLCISFAFGLYFIGDYALTNRLIEVRSQLNQLI